MALTNRLFLLSNRLTISRFMLSFIFVIMCVFLSRSKSVQVFYCWFISTLSPEIQLSEGVVCIILIILTLPYFWACPKPESGFPMPYIVVFFCVKWFEARDGSLFCWHLQNYWPLLFKLSFHKTFMTNETVLRRSRHIIQE
jgi:hypothetical protein